MSWDGGARSAPSALLWFVVCLLAMATFASSCGSGEDSPVEQARVVSTPSSQVAATTVAPTTPPAQTVVPIPIPTATPLPIPTPIPDPTLVPVPTPIPVPTAGAAQPVEWSLALTDRVSLRRIAPGFDEPSGLGFDPGNGSLWSVSDSTRSLFEFDPDGELITVERPNGIFTSLEGIAVDGDELIVVHEDDNELVRIDRELGQASAQRRLDEVTGYDEIESVIESGGGNKGLEGVAIIPGTDRLVVLKEGKPGVLVEVTNDLERIMGHRVLDAAAGFVDDDTDGDELDFSGVVVDPQTGWFWIVSDRGRRVFVYDWSGDQVVASIALDEIEKAEGVALDPGANRLYVVSESDVELYVYAIERS